MNPSQPQPNAPKLDAYLDGQLPPDECDALEREIGVPESILPPDTSSTKK